MASSWWHLGRILWLTGSITIILSCLGAWLATRGGPKVKPGATSEYLISGLFLLGFGMIVASDVSLLVVCFRS